MNDAVRPHAASGVVTNVLRGIVALTVMAVPLIFYFDGLDSWRLPKVAVFRAAAVVLTALTIAAALLFPRSVSRPSFKRAELVVLAGIVLLSILTTFVTTDRVQSVDALITVFCSVAFFVIATIVLRGQPVALTLLVIAVPAIANMVFVTLQALNVWNPLTHLITWIAPSDVRTGFLGNSNFLGTFMVTPVLVLLVAALTTRSRTQLLSVVAFAIAAVGFVLSRTLTAFIAFAAAAVVIAVIRWRRNAILAGVTVVLLVGTLSLLYRPIRGRIYYMRTVAAEKKYDRIFSGRLVAYATAVEMIRAKPLLGLGLGNFELNYMQYNRPVMARYPALKRSTSRGVNFGEAHNEPLQYWAETGVLGFVLFLAALALLALRGRGGNALMRILAPSFAVMLFVLSLAQFPFHLPASLIMNLYVGAFCFAHDPRD